MIWLRAVVILDSQRVSAHIHHQFERRVAIFRGFTPRTTLIIHPSQSLRNGAATKRLRLQLSALHKGPGDSGGVIEEHQIVWCLLARVFANNIVYNFLMKINAWLFCICPFPPIQFKYARHCFSPCLSNFAIATTWTNTNILLNVSLSVYRENYPAPQGVLNAQLNQFKSTF